MPPYIKTLFCLLAVSNFSININAQDCDFDFSIRVYTQTSEEYPNVDFSDDYFLLEFSTIKNNNDFDYSYEWFDSAGNLLSTNSLIELDDMSGIADVANEIFEVKVTNDLGCTMSKNFTRNVGISKVISNVVQEVCPYNGGGSVLLTIDGFTEDYEVDPVFGNSITSGDYLGGETANINSEFPVEPFQYGNFYGFGGSMLLGFLVEGQTIVDSVEYNIFSINYYTIESFLNLDNSISLISSQQDCAPSYLGQLEVNAENDEGSNLQYSWTNSLGESIGTSTLIDNLTADIYTITTIDINTGCSAQEEYEIAEIDFGIVYNVNPANCGTPAQGGINVDETGEENYTYEWAAINPEVDFNVLGEILLTSYSCDEEFVLTITDESGCVRVDDPVLLPCIVDEFILNAELSQDCDGTNVDILLDPQGGHGSPYSFEWYNGSTLLSNNEDLLNITEAGEYVVIALDAEDCFQQETINVTFQPVVISLSEEIVSSVICNGESNGNIEITLTGGVEPYDFTWSNGSSDEDQIGVVADSYSLDVLDANGCAENFSFEVTQPEAIAATLVTTDYLCPDGLMGSIDGEFNGGVGALSIFWINGQTTEDINDLSVGTYHVNVTDENGCIEEFSADVNLVENYDYSDVTVLALSDDLDNQTITVQNLLIVPNGLTAHINNSTINFAEEAGILIEPGGSLEIHNSILTNSGCSLHWKGIDVSGNNNLTQTPANQGKCVIHDSEVSNAVIGITNYNREDRDNTQGGIIETVYTDFINCEMGADIYKYRNWDPMTNAMTEQRIDVAFYNSSFTVDDNYQLPNFPKYRIRLYRVRGVKIEGCLIENTNADLFESEEMIGVLASRSTFALTNNWVGYPPYIDVSADLNGANISGFHYGLSSGMNATIFTTIIDDVDFANFRGAFLGYTNGARCTSNRFNNLSSNMVNFNPAALGFESNSHYGLYLNHSTGYWIEDNQFDFPDTHADRGIVVKSSGSDNNLIYRNFFYDCLYGIRSLDDNRGQGFQSGLKLSCNELTDSRIDIAVAKSYDGLNIPGQGISMFQGFSSLDGLDFSAGNRLSNDNIINYYDIHNSMDPITYFHVFSENIQIVNSQVNLSTSFTIENVCQSNLFDTKEVKLEKMADFNDQLAELKSEYQSVIDGGDTDGLLSIILNAKPSILQALKTRLLDISPNLSDEVILALIENEEDIPVGLLVRVLSANPWATKSAFIVNALKQRETQLTESQWNYIKQGISLPSQKETLESGISSLSNSSGAMLSQSMNLLGSDEENSNSIQEQIDILESNLSVNSTIRKAQIIAELGDTDLANDLLENLELDYEMTETEKEDVFGIQIILTIEENFELTGIVSAQDEDKLIEISQNRYGRSPGLAELCLEETGLVINDEPLINQSIEGRSNIDFSLVQSPNEVIIYPNPSDGHFLIETSNIIDQATINVFDVTGKLFFIQSKINLDNVINLDISNLKTGFYVLQVTDKENNIVLTEKIQILK